MKHLKMDTTSFFTHTKVKQWVCYFSYIALQGLLSIMIYIYIQSTKSPFYYTCLTPNFWIKAQALGDFLGPQVIPAASQV